VANLRKVIYEIRHAMGLRHPVCMGGGVLMEYGSVWQCVLCVVMCGVCGNVCCVWYCHVSCVAVCVVYVCCVCVLFMCVVLME